MNPKRELVRAAVLSYESVFVGAVWVVYLLFPRALSEIASLLATTDASFRLALFGVPVALVGGNYWLAEKTLNPESGKQVLKAWPQYWQLKTRIRVALGFSALGYIAWLIGCMLVNQHPTAGAAIGLGGIGSIAISLATVALAQLEVRDALDGV